ncbi:MAG: hypothetical protein ACKVOK_14975 [Flavobacteriales bacterium]
MSSKSTNQMEGRIVYDVTFPYEANTIMMDLFPKEMVIHFKGNKMHGEVKSSYEMLTSDFVIDNNAMTMTHMLKNMGERYALNLQGDDVAAWLKQYPSMRLEQTTETVNIAGYVCNKTLAHFPNDSLPKIELYHTKGLGIDNRNWWNQYSGIEGFLLGYDIEQYGKRMRMRAREVHFEQISDEQFTVPQNYKQVDMPEMSRQLMAVVDEFIQ